MARSRIIKRTRTRIPDYTCLGCPLTKSRTQRCFQLCKPVDGIGPCGRVAPHSLLGRTQKAIRADKIRRCGLAAQATFPRPARGQQTI